jgi:F-type H+-transporting ATPase subunit a
MNTSIIETLLNVVQRAALHYVGGAVSDFSWFQFIPGISKPVAGQTLGQVLHLHDAHDAVFIPTTWAIVLFILALAGLARLGLNRAIAREGTAKYLPDSSLTFRNAFEMAVEFINDMMVQNLGEKETKAFFPLVGSLFVFVLVANFSGFIPGLRPPTDNLSSNLAMALTVFVVFNYAGLSRNGLGYLKHLGGPVIWLAPAFFVLETTSLLVRPMSLSIRLYVNIFVDHLLQGIARDLGGPLSSVPGMLGAIVLPVPLYFLGLLVCSVQAFVFALLTVIYIAQAAAHEGDHGDGHDHDHGHAH